MLPLLLMLHLLIFTTMFKLILLSMLRLLFITTIDVAIATNGFFSNIVASFTVDFSILATAKFGCNEVKQGSLEFR